MPTSGAHAVRAQKARPAALFVALVFMFNLALSTMSSVVAYAQVVEDEVVEPETTEVVAEDVVEIDGEPATETEGGETTPEEEEIDPETAQEPLEEVAEEEVTEEANETTPEEVAVTTAAEESVEIEVMEPTLDVAFKCYTRLSLTEYSFTVSADASAEQTRTAGESDNTTTPDTYQAIVPETFSAGMQDMVVSGWDGQDFSWMIAGNTVDVSTEGKRCPTPTLADVLSEGDTTEAMSALIDFLAESEDCRPIYELFDSESGPYTVFAPNSDAFLSLVAAPATEINEIFQLSGNADELCALIGSHVVQGEFSSMDFDATGTTITTVDNDLNGIFIQKIGDDLFVDGHIVTVADQFASNGVVHVVSGVVLPQGVGAINPIETDKTSPALSGLINIDLLETEMPQFDLCVLVRIDGVPYVADVNGLTWSIEEGVVEVNPTKTNTLFDVIVRLGYGYYQNDAGMPMGCEDLRMEMESGATYGAQTIDAVTHGTRLLGLTMTRGVLSYPEPEMPVEEPGEVLGETTDEPVEVAPVAVAEPSAPACGKGVCGSVAQADQTDDEVDSDGDGVPDSQDPDPNDPNITGEDGQPQGENSSDSEDDTSSSDDNILLWFIAGGGVVVIWYLLWQRSGREV